jgi:hypothetical protein
MAKFVHNELLIMNAEEAVIAMLSRRYFNTAFPTKLFRRELVADLRFPEFGRYDDVALMYKLLAKSRKIAYHGLPKYIFSRHGENNSGWTTDYSLLSSQSLSEYLNAYRDRTEWLSNYFPNSAALWRYYDWSFQISMVDKIMSHDIQGCEEHLKRMLTELRAHREEFYDSLWIQDFERDWVRRYVHS